MSRSTNRRRAPRMRYRVTVRYTDNSEGRKTTSDAMVRWSDGFEGQMLDVSSGGLAFRCNADTSCPYEGQPLIVQFAIPNSEIHDVSLMEFNRTGRVLRVQEVNSDFRNIAFRFDEPLPVGKVFFDTVGLYLLNQENQISSIDDDPGTEGDISMEFILEQRIKELEGELAELRKLQLINAQPDKTE